jgi:DNA-binding response OmpR family regulator
MHILGLAQKNHDHFNAVTLAAQSNKHALEFTTDLEDAYERVKLYNFHAVVISESSLSRPLTLALIQRIRAKLKKTVTIFVLTDSSAPITHKVLCFVSGADDVIPSPVAAEELNARLLATQRRWSGLADNRVNLGPLELNLDTKRLYHNGVKVHLSGRLYATLETLVLARGRTVSREQLLNSIYGTDADQPEIKIVDVFITKIRQKLKPYVGDNFIETVWGTGYCIPTLARKV